MRANWKPGTMIYPLPAVLVSCGNETEKNILTIAWCGTICSDPAMCYISVRKERHSYDIIKKNMNFVINLTTKKTAYATDWCGVRSGKDFNKFKEMNLTSGKSTIVSSPYIEECPLNIECKVKQIVPLGSHDMFISEVVNVMADEQYLNKNGKLDFERAGLITYAHGQYYELGKRIGKFGWTVQKKKK